METTVENTESRTSSRPNDCRTIVGAKRISIYKDESDVGFAISKYVLRPVIIPPYNELFFTFKYEMNRIRYVFDLISFPSF